MRSKLRAKVENVLNTVWKDKFSLFDRWLAANFICDEFYDESKFTEDEFVNGELNKIIDGSKIFANIEEAYKSVHSVYDSDLIDVLRKESGDDDMIDTAMRHVLEFNMNLPVLCLSYKLIIIFHYGGERLHRKSM